MTNSRKGFKSMMDSQKIFKTKGPISNAHNYILISSYAHNYTLISSVLIIMTTPLHRTQHIHHNILRLGYYWSSMVKYFYIIHVIKYTIYKKHINLLLTPSHELHIMVSP